jgi:hypothetical protein
VGVAIFTAVVCAMTVAHVTGVLPTRAVAASPSALAAGRLWLLVTSGLLVQSPMAVSLLSFVALAVLTLVFCGARRLWVAALAGHVASTLLAYALVGSVRALDPLAFGGVWRAPDYGVSAIASAWLGAVAAVSWDRRGHSVRGRAPVILSCLAVAAFAWMVRRHLTILDSEHIFAFAIGVAIGRAAIPVRAGEARIGPGRSA